MLSGMQTSVAPSTLKCWELGVGTDAHILQKCSEEGNARPNPSNPKSRQPSPSVEGFAPNASNQNPDLDGMYPIYVANQNAQGALDQLWPLGSESMDCAFDLLYLSDRQITRPGFSPCNTKHQPTIPCNSDYIGVSSHHCRKYTTGIKVTNRGFRFNQ